MPPVLETFRAVPILREDIPMEIDSGYPFERNPDEGFRSQLDDIAKRHPELAEHLTSFAQSDRRQRRRSPDTASSTFPRRFPRHFGDRFERFGFPFDREEFQPEPEQEKKEQHKEEHKKKEEEAQAQPQRERSNNIQQSNTIDLGQKQEPINDRGKRSSSAPPTEKAPPGAEANVNRPNMSQPNQKTSNERIIPIHIEGRDEPVLPRNASPSSATAPPPPPTQQHSERIFGQRPEQFTQFLNREPRFPSNSWHSDDHRQPKFHQQPEEIPIPVHREVPVQKKQQQSQSQHQQQQQQQPPPPPPPTSNTQQPQPSKPQQRAASPKPPEPPKPAPPTPLDLIQAIQKDVSELIAQVEAFQGKPKDKQYLYLDEMLTRNLIKLDNIDTQGQEAIRNARKEAIKCIERTISILEAKAAAMAAASTAASESQEPMEAEPSAPAAQLMEVGPENGDEVTKEGDSERPSAEEQESNMSVDEAVKKFEGSGAEAPVAPPESEAEQERPEGEAEAKKEAAEDPKVEDKVEDSSVDANNKEKKKGKKKVDKKDK